MFYKVAVYLLFCLPAEFSHKLVLSSLKFFFKSDRLLNYFLAKAPQYEINKAGITFKNPVGLAGGFDKNGDYIDALLALGFGFIEVGTVTPLAQVGNKKPRLFRLIKHKALINRMGFNNKGVDYLVEQLKKRRAPGIVGVNVGKNKLTPIENAVDDYLLSVDKVYAYADYITINISSPNTPGLRKLQSFDALKILLNGLSCQRALLEEKYKNRIPFFIKITVDLTDDEVYSLVSLVTEYGFDGIISTNTSIKREDVSQHRNSHQPGGLSGAPLTAAANRQMQLLNNIDGAKDITLIASGGVNSPADAQARQLCGADLIQVYTGFIYSGPALIRQVVRQWGSNS